MNVAFFLTPKSEVIWVPETATLRQAIERMEPSRFAAIPILDSHGRYAGTLTEGDLLWSLWHSNRDAAQHLPLAQLARHAKYKQVSIDAEVEELLTLAAQQNFVPVADSRGVFIGIVRRKSIIEHCAKLLQR
ncbi:MAG: CBS domain-containing protein [Archangium sp.]